MRLGGTWLRLVERTRTWVSAGEPGGWRRARRARELGAPAGWRAGGRGGAGAGSPASRRQAPRPGARPRGHPIRPWPAGQPGRGSRLALTRGGNSGEVVPGGGRTRATVPARPGSRGSTEGGLLFPGCEGGIGGSTPLPGLC